MTWQNKFSLHNHALEQIATAPSLTVALSALGSRFSVRVNELGETHDVPDFLENWADFVLPKSLPLFTRRVSLCLNDMEVVHAQSICSPSSVWRNILDCGNTSLGTILFSGEMDLTRSDLFFDFPYPSSDPSKYYIVSRRSWFEYQGERLYLVECFLREIQLFIPHSSLDYI